MSPPLTPRWTSCKERDREILRYGHEGRLQVQEENRRMGRRGYWSTQDQPVESTLSHRLPVDHGSRVSISTDGVPRAVWGLKDVDPGDRG